MSTSASPKILLLHKGGIGDIVFALPLIASLERGFPGGELWVLTNEVGKDVLDFSPEVDRCVVVSDADRSAWLRSAIERVRHERFDIALTTVRSPRAGYCIWRSGAPVRVGFRSGLERIFFTHTAPLEPFEVVFSKRYQRLAQAIGLESHDEPPSLTVPEADRDRARTKLMEIGWNGSDPLVALHVGGGWPTKQWPTENIVSLGAQLSKRFGVISLLQGGPGDHSRAEEIAQALGPAAINTVGNSVAQALTQVSLCVAAVGLDSGLSHIAGAVGVPIVYLFGPNEPSSIVLSHNQQMLHHPDLDCRPCNRRGRTRCPQIHHRCMKELSAQSVLELLEPALRPPTTKCGTRASGSAPDPR